MTEEKREGRTNKGQFGAGNAGRPLGARNKRTVLLQQLFVDGGEKVIRKLIETAEAGDVQAARIVVDRLVPPTKDRPVQFALPKLEGAADVVKATAALVEAVAGGDLTPSEAAELSKVLDGYTRAIETTEIQARLARLEAAQRPGVPPVGEVPG